MSRHPRRRSDPIGFAHRGASAHAPENTLGAFALARRLGATGLESDVWLTADGVAVLDHDGAVGPRWRRRPVASLLRAELPARIPTLGELYAQEGTDFELSLDVKDPEAAESIVADARAAGADAAGRLWLCHHEWERVASWRALDDDIRLVDSTRLRRIKEGPEVRAAALAAAGVDAINLPARDWSGGMITLFHRFDRYCLGWDAQQIRVLDELMAMGCDGVFSDHVDRMMDAVERERAASA
jgi:glycerophosphoryl diester phosphodiesterase